MRINAIAAGQMKLRRSPFDFVQTHREVDRLFPTIKRLPFRARLNVPAAHRDNKGCTLPTDHPLVWHWHSLPRSVRSNAIGIRPARGGGDPRKTTRADSFHRARRRMKFGAVTHFAATAQE